MHNFKIKSIFLETTRVKKTRGIFKTIKDFQSFLPEHSFLTVRCDEIKLGRQKLSLIGVDHPKVNIPNTICLSFNDPLDNGVKMEIYIEGSMEDFNREFNNNQLDLDFTVPA